MHAPTGYADRWSVKQGGTIHFMVSSAGGRNFTLRFVRHLRADPNSAGLGYAERAMPTLLDGARAGREQHAHLGSFAHAALPADLRGGEFCSVGNCVWHYRLLGFGCSGK